MKILHTADIHLDSPFSSCDAKEARIKRDAMRDAFSSMMQYIKEEKIPLVLIAGDLFDHGFVTKKTAETLSAAFAALPETRFVISPGNHDPYVKGGVYAAGIFPSNVYIFKNEELEKISFDELGVDVYGYAFTSERLEVSPLAQKRAEDTGNIPLLCIHADLTSPISKNAPVSRADIAAFGARYAALGHIHKGEIGEGCAYPGCLIGRSFDETGEKGALLVDIEEDGGVKIEKKVFSNVKYEVERIDITGAEKDADAIAAINRMIEEKGYAAETTLRAVLCGEVSPSYIPMTEQIENSITEVSVEVKDETLPIFDSDALDADVTLRGEVWRVLKEKLATGTPEEREIAKKALGYALAALDGRAINE